MDTYEKGKLAKELKDNGLLDVIMQGIESNIIKAWMICTDKDTREEMHIKVRLLKGIKHEIQRCINDASYEKSIKPEKGETNV